MAKKERLGSDPLSWIGDNNSPAEGKAETSKPKQEAKSAAKPAPKPDPKPAAEEKKPVVSKVDAAPEKKAEQPASKPEPEKKPGPEKPLPAKKAVDSSVQSTSMSLLAKNRDIKKDARGSDVKKNLELEGKYLTFVLANEDYGIEITKVKEIMGLLPITRVPQTVSYIKGVINLRGKIVSVINMRTKFNMEEVENTDETCIIVVQTQMGEKGIIVDKVSEVLNIYADDIDSVPAFGTNIDTDYILGMAKVDDNVKILLDIESILSTTSLIGKKETV